MQKNQIGRRGVMKRALTVLGAAAVAPQLLAACGGEEAAGLSCTDTSGLAAAAVTTRESQAYADSSSDPNKKCSACNFFTAGQANQCGSCSVIQGPINPNGTCNLWAARPA
ncbi:MAG: high-potential iron-sulfur protein [Sandaracinaceae bacterium]|nr:high-potential iron-sulfur protein [Sandaracinaceae bacterium]